MFWQCGVLDLIANDNYYRKLNSVLDLRTLYEAAAIYHGDESQENIDPVMFFQICLVEYLNTINKRPQTDRFL